MLTRRVTIVNKLGLHARAAARFVTVASKFRSEITVRRGARSVNGKSIMGVMMLAAAKGTELEVSADGEDEELAQSELAQLVADRFGEPE